MRPRKYDYHVNDVIDDQKIIEIIPPLKGSGDSVRFKVVCQKCGREKFMLGATLARRSGTKHSACGKTVKTKDKRFYSIWQNIRTRTTNTKYEHYNDYGGRGINSDEFKNFIDFYDSMYTSYKEACNRYGENNVSIERLDVNGNYCVSNCTWIPISEQKGNTRKTVYFEIEFPDGHTERYKNLQKYAKEFGLNASCLRDLLSGRLKTYKGLKARRLSRKCND